MDSELLFSGRLLPNSLSLRSKDFPSCFPAEVTVLDLSGQIFILNCLSNLSSCSAYVLQSRFILI